MGYIKLPADDLDLTKATVSLWFRVPSETITNVIANPPPRNGAAGYSEAATWPVLQWELTLLSWGEQVSGTIDTIGYGQTGTDFTNAPINGGPIPLYGPVPGPSQTGPMAPCYIGLHCGEKIHLVFNFQSSQKEDAQNIIHYSYEDITWIGELGMFGHPFQNITHPDATNVLVHPISVGNGSNGSFPDEAPDADPSKFPDIKPDQWHHLILSWDMSGSISCGGDLTVINSDFKIYFALDDKNYDKSALPATWIGDVRTDDGPGSAGKAPNTVVSNFGRFNLPWPGGHGVAEDGISYHEDSVPPGSYSGEMGKVAVGEMFIPGSSSYTDGARTVNSVYKVQMAELLIFPGVVLDTSEEANRRLFISAPDKNNFQHPTNGSPITIPYLKYSIGDPATWDPGADDFVYAPPLFDPTAMPTAIPITGKPATTAAVDFTKCSFNWMMGRNLGTLKGQTETVGKMKSYWPGPNGSDPKIEAGSGGGGGGSGGSGGGG